MTFVVMLSLLSVPLAAVAQLPPGTTDASQTETVTTDPLRTQAGEALQNQDYPAAFKLLTALTEKYPTEAPLLYNLGYVEDARNNDAGATAAYQKSISADPNFFPPHLALGLLLARTGKLTEAHTELVKAVTLPTEDPALKARAYRALARLDQSSDPAAASADLLEALKLSPESVDDALLVGELAEAANDLPTAENAYRRILKTHDGNPTITAALAHLLLSLKRAPEAETLLTGALAKHPADTTLTSQLAATYAAEDKTPEAITLVDTLHTAKPADDNLTRLLAHLYSDNKEPAKAAPLYAALLLHSPHDVNLLADQGEAQLALQQYPEAQATLSQALTSPKAFKKPADMADAAQNLAFAASHNKNSEIVLQALTLRATVLPQSPASLFLAATAHDSLHHSKQASDLYKQFLTAAAGKFPDQEWEASHRLIALQHSK
ncbi:tetratricopeptide repeat protein [Granulicella arctica]|uniref:tetratricopeptide repeat protein n=1 Tax=Granulicella arctica TaxID=940613 RepID=UPI0021E08F18|nr:tetratricopeptide repeat protein [Granulicella arctica]